MDVGSWVFFHARTAMSSFDERKTLSWQPISLSTQKLAETANEKKGKINTRNRNRPDPPPHHSTENKLQQRQVTKEIDASRQAPRTQTDTSRRDTTRAERFGLLWASPKSTHQHHTPLPRCEIDNLLVTEVLLNADGGSY